MIKAFMETSSVITSGARRVPKFILRRKQKMKVYWLSARIELQTTNSLTRNINSTLPTLPFLVSETNGKLAGRLWTPLPRPLPSGFERRNSDFQKAGRGFRVSDVYWVMMHRWAALSKTTCPSEERLRCKTSTHLNLASLSRKRRVYIRCIELGLHPLRLHKSSKQPLLVSLDTTTRDPENLVSLFLGKSDFNSVFGRRKDNFRRRFKPFPAPPYFLPFAYVFPPRAH